MENKKKKNAVYEPMKEAPPLRSGMPSSVKTRAQRGAFQTTMMLQRANRRIAKLARGEKLPPVH